MRLGGNRAFPTHTERIGVEELLRRVRDAAGTGRPFRLPRLLPARRRSRRAGAVSAALATGAVPVLGYGVDRWALSDGDRHTRRDRPRTAVLARRVGARDGPLPVTG
ncbi:hypothetical protein AB0900_01880 [Streptomyces cellulosae]|uniref:hypothetical protein n=1 Tax=unclassified Streptomyces TaxID=2593676 RepID=UPI001BDA742C